MVVGRRGNAVRHVGGNLRGGGATSTHCSVSLRVARDGAGALRLDRRQCEPRVSARGGSDRPRHCHGRGVHPPLRACAGRPERSDAAGWLESLHRAHRARPGGGVLRMLRASVERMPVLLAGHAAVYHHRGGGGPVRARVPPEDHAPSLRRRRDAGRAGCRDACGNRAANRPHRLWMVEGRARLRAGRSRPPDKPFRSHDGGAPHNVFVLLRVPAGRGA